jgi:membrane protein required for colicin V production
MVQNLINLVQVNGIDFIIMILLIIALVRGFIKGFVMQLAALAALLLGIYACIHFSSYMGNLLASKVSLDPLVIRWLSFGLLFALVVIAVHLIGKLVEKILKMSMLSFANRVAGALFAFIKMVFIVAVLVTLTNLADQKLHFLPADTNKSILYRPVSKIIPAIFPRFFHNHDQQHEKSDDGVVDLENSIIIEAKYYLCENFSYDLG